MCSMFLRVTTELTPSTGPCPFRWETFCKCSIPFQAAFQAPGNPRKASCRRGEASSMEIVTAWTRWSTRKRAMSLSMHVPLLVRLTWNPWRRPGR